MIGGRGIGFALGGALALASGAAAQERGRIASPFGALGIGRMSELATQVVAGSVERMEAHWNHDRSRIQTRITMRVERVLAGRAGERVVFRIPGGTVGETTVMVSEMPQFRVGEDALVFLRGTRGRLPSVLGGLEGKLPLSRAEDGSLALVFPIELAPAQAQQTAGGERAPTRELDDLERFVRGRARRSRPGSGLPPAPPLGR